MSRIDAIGQNGNDGEHYSNQLTWPVDKTLIGRKVRFDGYATGKHNHWGYVPGDEYLIKINYEGRVGPVNIRGGIPARNYDNDFKFTLLPEDFNKRDDSSKSIDIAATSVPDGYYHDDEEDKLKPLKPESVPLQYDPADVAFKSDKNERGAGMKYDSGKPRMSLVPPHALTEMAKVMTFGASKYKAHSWKQVENAQERYLDALLRHAIAYVAGERIDPESGLPTMAHIMCDAAFLIELDMFNNTERSTEVNK